MKHLPRTLPPVIIYGFLSLGLICTVCFRSLTILDTLKPEWVRPVWYLGVIGYIFFFSFRYYITVKRKKAIEVYRLAETVTQAPSLNEEQRAVLLYLLNSIKKSKESINYLVIFILSALAIILDLLLH